MQHICWCPLQVSVDVPWSPYGIDGRSYDWQGLAQAADLLFVMAYDMQSQVTSWYVYRSAFDILHATSFVRARHAVTDNLFVDGTRMLFELLH